MKFALIGYGKMGKTIESIIDEQNSRGLAGEVVLKIDESNPADFTIKRLCAADVAIEFTQPDAAVNNMFRCFEAGVPIVVGTTAWLKRLEEVKNKCRELNGTLFYSPNFSIGVNIFWEVNRRLAQLINQQLQYRIELEEIHHTEKKDAPSGTAVKTAEIILEETNRWTGWHLQENKGDEPEREIPIVAKRESNVPGTHTVTYRSNVDAIELKHEAFSRRGFAEGAVLAARWIVGKKGVYGMKDLLSI